MHERSGELAGFVGAVSIAVAAVGQEHGGGPPFAGFSLPGCSLAHPFVAHWVWIVFARDGGAGEVGGYRGGVRRDAAQPAARRGALAAGDVPAAVEGGRGLAGGGPG